MFISFHIEDEAQVELLRSQAKDPRFEVEFTDYSVKEPFDEKWKTRCEERIKQSSMVCVALGPETWQRPAVRWEVKKAYELGKPVIGIRLYKKVQCPIPDLMRQEGAKVFGWKIDDIQNEIQEIIRDD